MENNIDINKFLYPDNSRFIDMHAAEIINSEDNMLFRTFMTEAAAAFNYCKDNDSNDYMEYIFEYVWPIIQESQNNKHKLEDMLIKQKIMSADKTVIYG